MIHNNIATSTFVSDSIQDYRVFCFDDEPRFLKVDFDRFVDHHANYYDLGWNLLPFGEADLPPVESHIEHCRPISIK